MGLESVSSLTVLSNYTILISQSVEDQPKQLKCPTPTKQYERDKG